MVDFPKMPQGITPQGLEELQMALSQGATAEGMMAGLDQQMGRANALRDQSRAADSGNPWMGIGDVLSNFAGNRQARKIEPQQNKQRGLVAAAQAAREQEDQRRNQFSEHFKLYDAAEKKRTGDRDYARGVHEFDQGHALDERAANRAEQGAADTSIKSYERVRGEEGPESIKVQELWVDGKLMQIDMGTGQPLPPGALTNYEEYYDQRKRAASGVATSRLSRPFRENLNKTVQSVKGMDNLYAGLDMELQQPAGKTGLWVTKQIGDLSTSDLAQYAADDTKSDELRRHARWWADFRTKAELIKRHELFGSALTANEQKLWDDALMMKPGMNPIELKERMEILALSERRLLHAMANNRLPDAPPEGKEVIKRSVAGIFEYDPESDSLIYQDADGNHVTGEYMDNRIQEYYKGSGQKTYEGEEAAPLSLGAEQQSEYDGYTPEQKAEYDGYTDEEKREWWK